ncbi:hypothetical protein CASFOL_033089 [Castilleja foliolosa]|uniref:KIB1-4 beta-propeller domain-containing protein n=1 Tax=Castilleja foliolosa TaxID=1961234 RepID=A0ABD3C478_9LAMI
MKIRATKMSSPSRLLLRSISHQFAGSSKYLISKSPTSFKPFNSLFRHHMSTAVAPSELHSSIQNSPPWLMLPLAFGGAMVHNFYSLSENKVITLTGSGENELTDLMSKPNHHRVLTGSSHGYLALFNKQNLDLFLYNPISGNHIKVPPIHNLPSFPSNNSTSVTKVILSCSPDEDYENCRAVMMYNCTNLMAVCCPGRSYEWTPFGRYPNGYEECVFSSEHQLLFGLTNNDDYLETWDLRDLSSPRMILSNYLYSENSDSEDEDDQVLENFCITVDHLVVANNHLLFVTQHVMESVGPDGSYVDYYEECERSINCPHLTVDFQVYKYDPEKGDFRYEDSLDDLALFIGLKSDTVALPAAKFPGIKPNSIYFTDTIGKGHWFGKNEDAPFRGHDIGIFNYEDKTVSSCYYPCDVQSIQRILPSPMWFFPSSSI